MYAVHPCRVITSESLLSCIPDCIWNHILNPYLLLPLFYTTLSTTCFLFALAKINCLPLGILFVLVLQVQSIATRAPLSASSLDISPPYLRIRSTYLAGRAYNNKGKIKNKNKKKKKKKNIYNNTHILTRGVSFLFWSRPYL